MKGIMILFFLNHASGERDALEFVNPLIINISTSINGVPHKKNSDGMKRFDLWKNILERVQFVEDHFTEMNFHNDKFAIFINLKSTQDNNLHGDGIEVGVNNNGIKITLDYEGAKAELIVNCYIFCISDAALFIQDRIVKEYRIQPV